MAIQRRNNTWFAVFFVAMIVFGWAVLSGARAGSDSACGTGGQGRIQWVWQPVPGYSCVTGLHY